MCCSPCKIQGLIQFLQDKYHVICVLVLDCGVDTSTLETPGMA